MRLPRLSELTDEQRSLAHVVAGVALVDERTARRAVLFGPENLRCARVREACGRVLAELQAAGVAGASGAPR
jgi:hypothetical protein